MESNNLNMDEICKRLVEIKKVRKLSNNEIAEAAESTAQTIYIMLKGEIKKPNLTILTNISKNLGVNLNWLLYGEGQKVQVMPVGISSTGNDNEERNVESKIIQELYKVAMERIEDLKKDIENRDYTIRLQRNIMQTNGLNFRLVVVKNPSARRRTRLARIIKINQVLKNPDNKKNLHLQAS